MGNGSGQQLPDGSMIGLSSTSLSAGGAASLTCDDRGSERNPVHGCLRHGDIQFALRRAGTCDNSGLGNQHCGPYGRHCDNHNGKRQRDLHRQGLQWSDVISATATVGTQSLTATGTITVAAAAIGSMQFVSATPATIGLKGTGLWPRLPQSYSRLLTSPAAPDPVPRSLLHSTRRSAA